MNFKEIIAKFVGSLFLGWGALHGLEAALYYSRGALTNNSGYVLEIIALAIGLTLLLTNFNFNKK